MDWGGQRLECKVSSEKVISGETHLSQQDVSGILKTKYRFL